MCNGWGRGFWRPGLGVKNHPTLETKMIDHRLKWDWELFNIERRKLETHHHWAKADDMVARRNEHFVRMNPMAGTFEWSALVEKAYEDQLEGLNITTSVHIWKAMAHSRWRREERERYVAWQEKKAKKRWRATHHNGRTLDEWGWTGSFDSPDVWRMLKMKNGSHGSSVGAESTHPSAENNRRTQVPRYRTLQHHRIEEKDGGMGTSKYDLNYNKDAKLQQDPGWEQAWADPARLSSGAGQAREQTRKEEGGMRE